MMNDIEHNKHSFSKHLYTIPPHPILYSLHSQILPTSRLPSEKTKRKFTKISSNIKRNLKYGREFKKKTEKERTQKKENPKRKHIPISGEVLEVNPR